VARSELRKEWEQRIAEFRASGQTAVAWCAAHDVNLHRFRYWLRKFPTKRATESTPSVRWLSVKVDEPPVAEDGILLVRVGSASIEVKPGYNPTLLRQVVQTLATLC
jgi:hypothetical protein